MVLCLEISETCSLESMDGDTCHWPVDTLGHGRKIGQHSWREQLSHCEGIAERIDAGSIEERGVDGSYPVLRREQHQRMAHVGCVDSGHVLSHLVRLLFSLSR